MSIFTSQTAAASLTQATLLGAGLAVAALGGWSLWQALSRPELTLGMPDPVARQGVAVTPTAPEPTLRSWPLVFGHPVTPAPAQPELVAPEPVFEAFDDIEIGFDPSLYALRGVVVTDAGGWAMIEAEGRVEIKRPGDFLLEGEMITRISETGVELDVFGETHVLSLAQRGEPAPPRAPSQDPALTEDEAVMDLTQEDDLGIDDGGIDYGGDTGPNADNFERSSGRLGHQDAEDLDLDEVMDLSTDDADFARQMGIGR